MWSSKITIGDREISIDQPTYFVADIAANHDGDLERAKDLIWKAKEAGADAAKFQHFKAKDIVSDFGFRALGGQLSHQEGWKKSVYEVYEQYELQNSWNMELIKTADQACIDFMTTPYDYTAVEDLDKHLPAYKIGSGDITWIDFIQHVARKNKPIMIATGASSSEDVVRAVDALKGINNKLILMQCNTNYTGSVENFKHINLNVLKSYATAWPNLILGLSDHSPGHATVLGAIALGARVVEKHFTDDYSRVGPDHAFSMTPQTWREMVDRSRELESALGDGFKRVEHNEQQTAVVQQRCLRLRRTIKPGEVLQRDDICVLRPAPSGSAKPYEMDLVAGRRIKNEIAEGDAIRLVDLED